MGKHGQGSIPIQGTDSKQDGKVKRFVGDTLFGRMARSAVQTVSTTWNLNKSLSPWGDNNSVTLPNIRYRDAVLFGTFSVIGTPLLESTSSGITNTFGAGSLVAELLTPGIDFFVHNTVAKYLLFQVIEQAIDKGILDHILPEESKMITTTNLKSIRMIINHKLMDADASISFVNPYPAQNKLACEKGWFCPYLFASNRTPVIPRSHDFEVAQFWGPSLVADIAVAHRLLAELPAVIGLCNADPAVNIGCKRMLACFVGISPFRAGMWSTSRRPGAATVNFHLSNGVPAVVVPVMDNAPVGGWTTATFSMVRDGRFDPAYQHGVICNFLDGMVDQRFLNESVKKCYEQVLGRAVSMLVNGMVGMRDVPGGVLKGLDAERAGVVFFRY